MLNPISIKLRSQHRERRRDGIIAQRKVKRRLNTGGILEKIYGFGTDIKDI